MSGIDVAHEIPPYAPAPAASPLALSSSSRTAPRVVLVVLAALVTLGTLSSLGALAFGVSSIRVVDDTQALPARIRSLTVDIRGVPVAVSVATDLGATEPRVDLRAVTTNDDTGLAVANDVAGSRVTLRDSVAGYMRWGRSHRITLRRFSEHYHQALSHFERIVDLYPVFRVV